MINIKSPSKLNFALWIKGKRSDNYHELETIYFENNNLCDDIALEFNKSNELKVNSIFVQEELNQIIPNDKNLTTKAALLFFKKLGIKGFCKITINKKIPIQAGLGGGSSNAGCVLKGLNQLFDYYLNENELLVLSNQIGSDVPFFILGDTCFGSGRGGILKKIKNNLKLEIEIIKPENISISTKWAYEQIDSREFQASCKEEIESLIYSMKVADYDMFFKNIFNDFEIVVFSYYPELIKLRKLLLDKGYKTVGLCGSGSALYGVKKSEKAHT
ncbi:MAG: 4-(cytidine 5'-diphospho)-2-C-methyl-D-erythritol kinase [Candidatus Melainabacteria bacterium]|nr:4-(cytidine 5'-diphospho)-2-C-methyl-D-erythritol kinase [Candidatus Melainabacteria bacterium]